MPDDRDDDMGTNNVRNLRPVENPPGRVLRIVAGLHAGASRALADQEMLVVGSGDDCDIVLADTGVAAHHALITLVGGAFTLRALDAPLRIEGKPLHPGDPVEVRPLQRIDLGEAAIAFGDDDESAWDALFPALADPARKRRARPFLRRLPMIAAGAVLLLAAVAVIVAFFPGRGERVDTSAFLKAMVPQYKISDSRVTSDVNGIATLSGTVESDVVKARAEQALAQSGVDARLSLRTGEDLARDVREVFRMGDLNVDARYLGDNRVEVSSETEIDPARVDALVASRAMSDVGVRVVRGKGLSDEVDRSPRQDPMAQAAAQAPVDIVSVVRGNSPYVVDSNGVQYPDGAIIPGHGKLVGIGSKIYVEGANGEIKQIRPITAAELAARAAAADFENVVGTGSAAPAKPSADATAVGNSAPKPQQKRQ